MAVVRAHVWISGQVQGVYFRETARAVAESEGVRGWVRNLADGRVEAVFEGEEAAVRRCLEWCAQGPPAAVVSGVETRWETPTGEFLGFTVRRWR